MPKRDDISSILILGSGPIVIGQACEFDYSGTQACRALTREGYRVVLVNSNPATIMTDPGFADRTYVEPLTPAVVEKIIEREKPDALLPTVGGQTGINLTLALDEQGVLERYGVELLGAATSALRLGEDRLEFKDAMVEIGLEVPASGYAGSIEEAEEIVAEIGYPTIIRPSFTLGGEGGGTAFNHDEMLDIVARALDASPVHKILIEQSVVGWKEFELEVMRDVADNAIVVCSVENVDAMGVHTGDSITVAPQQTLSDHEYQQMRDDAFRVIRRVGVATGGSNIQFAVDPRTGRRLVIEMNPRVSRSSALASKATGFPIAKIAALLAVGYTLDEIPNDITGETYAAFEPSLDYTVVKIPRWAFEKFPASPPTLGTSMKSVGEVMAIGGTFREALMKALASLELDSSTGRDRRMADPVRLRSRLAEPNWERLFAVFAALRQGWTVDEVTEMSHLDPWFLREIKRIVDAEAELGCWDVASAPADRFAEAAASGIPLKRMASLLGCSTPEVEDRMAADGLERVYKRIDTCAAEFPALTPYLYSTFGDEDEAEPSDRPKVVILGSGPNRIGQGIEFDYCCVHASYALREAGYETVMVNCNPETVSTDYDTSDRLYFEPLTEEHVLAVVEKECPEGVIVQLGGQTPLKLASALAEAGAPIWGTPPEAIDLAEDRERFGELLLKHGILQPENGIARSVAEGLAVAEKMGFPVLVRPSYVLGGRAMAICYERESLESYLRQAAEVSEGHSILIDRYLENAVELDLDLICDGERAVVAGILQHIEEAGVHSGDSAAVLPPHSVAPEILDELRRMARQLALDLGVVGLMNVQAAVHEGRLYVLEVNPRASRTVPFIAKAIGVPLAKLAARVMAGSTLEELGLTEEPKVPGVFLKAPVFPFTRFPEADPVLGPEMKATGEVMGVADDVGSAFAKAWVGAGNRLPTGGTAFVSVRDADKEAVEPIARRLAELGFRIIATDGTARHLERAGLDVELVRKLTEGRPHVVDRLSNDEVDLVINTPAGHHAHADDAVIRQTALRHAVPCITTIAAATAAVEAIAALQTSEWQVSSLQERTGGVMEVTK